MAEREVVMSSIEHEVAPKVHATQGRVYASRHALKMNRNHADKSY